VLRYALASLAPALAVVVALAWAARGLPTDDHVHCAAGLAGTPLGLLAPLALVRAGRVEAPRAHRLPLVFYALAVPVWAAAYCVTEFLIGLSA
jgi:hypothetical protein